MHTQQLFGEVAALGVDPASTVAALLRAAVGTDERQGPRQVSGFTLQGAPGADGHGPSVVLFVVVGRELVRFEAADGQTMTVTVPASRVTCLTERTTAVEYQVVIELDAQSTVTIAESRSSDGSELVQQMGRTDRASYTLTAPIGVPADVPGTLTADRLMAFRSALRHAMAS